MMPKMMQMQKEIIHDMDKAMSQAKPGQQAAAQQFKSMFDKMFENTPDWIGPAATALGFIGLLANAIYIYAAISLLLLKRYAIKLFYAAVFLCVLVDVIRGAVFFKAFSFMGLAVLSYGLAGVMIDLILLAVVATAKQDAFLQGA